MSHPPGTVTFPPRRLTLAALFLLAVLVGFIYLQARTFPFVDFDDKEDILDNPHVLTGFSFENVTWALTATHRSNWKPLTWGSHMLDSSIFGTWAGGHHLVSAALHLLNVWLLFALVLRMTGRPGPSMAVAALFAAHPVNVESVVWLAERKQLIATVFALLALHAYVRLVQARSMRLYCGALLCFMLSLAANPTWVALPALLLLLDYWPLHRCQDRAGRASLSGRTGAQLLLEKLPFFALAGGGALITLWVQGRGGSVMPLEWLPLHVRLANAALAYVRYLELAVWPTGLCAFYPHRGHALPWTMAVAAGIALFVVTLFVLGLNARSGGRRAYLPVGWFWFLIALAPMIGVIQVGAQSMADRYAYVPYLGLFIVVVWTFAEWPAMRRAVPIMAAGVIIVLACAARVQTGHWRDSKALFGQMLDVTADNYFAHHNLGVVCLDEGNLTPAVAHLGEAARIQPRNARIRCNLGLALLRAGRCTEAMEQFRSARQLGENSPTLWDNIGSALDGLGQTEDAITQYQHALEMEPDFRDAHHNLAGALMKQQRFAEAQAHFESAVRKDPQFVEARLGLARALAALGELDNAERECQTALELEPGNADAHFNLGVIALSRNQPERALEHLEAATRIHPGDPGMRAYLDRARAAATKP